MRKSKILCALAQTTRRPYVVMFFVLFTSLNTMRTFSRFTMCFILLLATCRLSGQMRYIENGNQWPEEVHFRTEIPGGKFYLEKGRFTFDLYDTQTTAKVFAAHHGETTAEPVPEMLDCHAYRIRFGGSNEASIPEGRKAFSTRYSFFIGNEPEKWAGDLSAFEEVRYPELYTGIDLKVYENGPAKYDFIVKPGADPDQIRLIYEGVKPKKQKNGSLLLKTAVGEVTESKPFAYQMIDGLITPVGCAYRISGREVRFDLDGYDTTVELIIDPELIFSTYSGSTADNFGYTATYDEAGHLYAGSSVFGSGYPTTTGAYQAGWAGGTGAGALAGTDIALTKFSLDGTDVIYSTYLGGSGDDLPHSLITDAQNNLYMLGTSGSKDYPVLAGTYQPVFAGGQPTTLGGIGVAFTLGCDIVVTRLNPAGTGLGGSTYVGGSENDGVNTATGLRYNYADEVRGEIELDEEGNVVIGSSTLSDDFPVTAGAFQTVKNDQQEGVLFRLNPTLTSLMASTYYGGNGSDAIYSIDIGEEGITAGGGTRSSDLAQAGLPYQAAFGGGAADGFLAVFNDELSALEHMTYFGSGTYDQVYFTERDEAGHVYCYGQTEAPDDTFIFNAEYSVPNSGMLLAKFEKDLDALVWSTVFGDGNNVPNLSPGAFSVDICDRIFLSGWGGATNNQGSTAGLPVTPDALQSSTDGSDFYFLVIDGDATALTFASFFGGATSNEHVDGGTSRFDRSGKIYQAVCAGCGSNDDFPIQPENAWSPTNNSFNCNLGVAKIDFDLPLVLADFDVETACLPEQVEFTNNSVAAGVGTTFFWDLGDGNFSNQNTPSHTYDGPGTYTVTLVVWDPLACNLSDTVSVTFEVFDAVEIEGQTELFSCESNEFDLAVTTNGAATLYTWASDPQFADILVQGPTDSTYTLTTNETTTVYILAESGFCNAETSITVYPPPIAQLGIGDTLICNEAKFTTQLALADSAGFTDFTWSPDALITNGQGTSSASFFADSSFTLFATAVSPFGCLTGDSAVISVFPIALEAPSDTLLCNEEPLVLEANSFGTATDFLWSDQPDFSNILNMQGDSTVTVAPAGFTHFYVQAVNGPCTLTDSTAVSFFNVGTTLTDDLLICAGDTVFLSVTNDFPGTQLTHVWEPEELIISGQNTSGVAVAPSEPTTFTAVSTAQNGACTVENAVTVFTSPLGDINVSAEADPDIIAAGGSSVLSAFPADAPYTYQWSPIGSLDSPVGPQVTASPTETTIYEVILFDQDSLGSCIKNATVTITVVDVVCGEPYIYVPNAFTPNGDGENDVLFVRGGNIAFMKFAVYDRWGELVFETQDQSRGWDGTHKGSPAGPAVFVYHLEVDCGDGQTHFQKGNVTLIR